MRVDKNLIDDITDRIDVFMKPFYKKDIVSRVENIPFYISLIAMGWHKKVTESLRAHFDTLTKIVGALSIVFGFLGLLSALGGMGIISAFGPGYATYLVVSLATTVVLCFLGIVSGFGLLGKKEWIPFLAIVQFGVNIVSQIVFQIAEACIPKTTVISVWGMPLGVTTQVSPITLSWIISFLLSAVIGFIGLSFVIRLKDMFGKREMR